VKVGFPLLCVAAIACGASIHAAPPSGFRYDPATQIPPQRPPATVREGFTFLAAGDLIMGQPILDQTDGPLEKTLEIVRAADVAMANQETPVFAQDELQLPPGPGGLLIGTPDVAKNVKAMGIDVVSVANNHAVDWGLQGLLETMRTLRGAGLAFAGGGPSRAAARAPAYIETPKGRLGFVAAASTTNGPSLAADGVAEAPARPGISVIRTTRIASVSPAEFDVLKGIATRYGSALSSGDQLTLLDQTFRVSSEPGFTYVMNPIDEYEVLKAVRASKQKADVAVFTVHAHESLIGGDESPIPADFLPKLYHEAIDAGADIVVNHGSHALRGIELYKGKPIFYGIGTFVFQSHVPATQDWLERFGLDPRTVTPGDMQETVFAQDPAEWHDSIIAAVEFGRQGRVREIRIYPIDLRAVPPSKLRGLPRLATREVGERILTTMRRLSEPYGTDLRIVNGVGIIHPAAGRP